MNQKKCSNLLRIIINYLIDNRNDKESLDNISICKYLRKNDKYKDIQLEIVNKKLIKLEITGYVKLINKTMVTNLDEDIKAGNSTIVVKYQYDLILVN
jgi:hypothetical protein